MARIARFPVVLRIGDLAEAEIATIDFPIHGDGRCSVDRRAIAGMLRAAADAYEHPDQEEDLDAAS